MCIQTTLGMECKGELGSNNRGYVRKKRDFFFPVFAIIIFWYLCMMSQNRILLLDYSVISKNVCSPLSARYISRQMSLWFQDICGGLFLPYARQHSPTGQGYYSEVPGWPASTHWILELRSVTSEWNGKSCISNDSGDRHNDKKGFFYDGSRQGPLNVDSRGVQYKWMLWWSIFSM